MSKLAIGVGNQDRGDDAVGPRVIELLSQDAPAGLDLALCRGDLSSLLERWSSAKTVYLVDALQPGSRPGRILQMDASRNAVSTDLDAFVSSHTLNLAEAIELARALDRLPPRLLLFGIEAVSFRHGAELNPEVQRSAAEVASLIRQECAPCTKPR